MRAASEFPAGSARRLRGVLFDLDDTVLTRGRLELAAYEALFRLRDSGLRLVAVTGRPSGWAEVLARQWPVDGVVAENGAVHVVRDGHGVTVAFDGDVAAVHARHGRLTALVGVIAREVPAARLTDDVHARRTDVTWDVAERERLPERDVARILELAAEAGARTTRSSVHVHASYERDDKASGAVRFLRERCGEEPGAALGRWAFVGDSANDAPCFAAFESTFGVKNVETSVRAVSVPPRWIATRERGDGFAEIAAVLTRARAT